MLESIIQIFVSFDFVSLLAFFGIIFLTSFALPTFSLFFIINFSSIATTSQLILIILIVFVAATVGDILAYYLARFVSRKYEIKIRKFVSKSYFIETKKQKVSNLFRKYGILIIFFSRFILPGTGPFINYYSGFKRIKRKKFIIAVIAGELIYAIMYPLIAKKYHLVWKSILIIINSLAGLILFIIILYFTYRLITKIQRKEHETKMKKAVRVYGA